MISRVEYGYKTHTRTRRANLKKCRIEHDFGGENFRFMQQITNFVLILSLLELNACICLRIRLLTRLKQAKGNESIQIKRERFHDSETLKKQAGKTQYTIDAVTGWGEVYDKYAFVHNRGLATKPANVS